MFNLLADNIITLFSSNFGEGLNWIGRVIQWIIGIAGNVGLGIILFTLVLKLITLPLDIYSKAKMRKNNLKMEKMRPQLEKLQKQYQNDQTAYNQKMMELYKKNGYSMFGACLPMVVTLVIFMVVLGAFSSYSQYTNVDVYRQMTAAYNAAILEYTPETFQNDGEGEKSSVTAQDIGNGRWQYTLVETFTEENALVSVRVERTYVSDKQLTEAEIQAIDWKGESVTVANEYSVQTASVLNSTDEAIQAIVSQVREDNADNAAANDDFIALTAVQQVGRNAAEAAYDEYRMGFLWVKNIWLPDTSYQHPVQYESELNNESLYNEITYNLSEQKGAANGYYILIVISIGTMFLSQFIISKSQKAQNDLQTADGRGAKTQKVMLIIMPIIFGIFSFFYSAAFSIYMITGNIFSILSTVLTNFFIDRKFKKIEEQEIQEKYNKRIPQAARKETKGKSGGKKK